MLKNILYLFLLIGLFSCGDKQQEQNTESANQKNSDQTTSPKKKGTTSSVVFNNEIDSFSYAYGSFYGANLRMGKIMDKSELNIDLAQQGLMHGLEKKESVISLEDGEAIIMAFQSKKQQGETPIYNDALIAKDGVELTTLEEKVSYLIGYNIGSKSNIGGLNSENLSVDVWRDGFTDGFMNNELLISTEKGEYILDKYMMKLEGDMAEFNKKEGEDFLVENKSKENIITTESGLQYEVLKEGTGPKPKATQTVTVHYKGTLIDGSVFDSSYDSGQPATFPLNGVISGWTEGLQLMPLGSKYKFYIPYDLAYGPQGNGPIPPYSTLIFEVELLSIK